MAAATPAEFDRGHYRLPYMRRWQSFLKNPAVLVAPLFIRLSEAMFNPPEHSSRLGLPAHRDELLERTI
ncbi:hypothetical protein AB4Z52_22070 [Rhizobium sp. 2YAF20]|uniref:hypothetical protein n=1 Tax=Rhizobium sp. 2YAF20 TaxID=3233027 RepID=UPI003F984CA6